MKILHFITLFCLMMISVQVKAKTASSPEKGKHLFILSGQSNMAGLDEKISFIPSVEAEFGKDNVIIVKDAMGGQPIRRWYKKWKPAQGDTPKVTGDLYNRLMSKVNKAIKKEKLASVTFIWMQGEKDAREKHGMVYAASLKGLIAQLSDDLGRKDVNFVIGRLSDYDMNNKKYQHWTMVRKAQVEVAESSPRGEWVDTDSFNDGINKKGNNVKNDLHYSVEGYRKLGKSFADKAIKLIKAKADFEAKVFKGKNEKILIYRIHKPGKIDKKKKYPLVLVLHGAGARGNDNTSQIKRKVGPLEIFDYAKNKKMEVIIIAPQVPAREQWVNVRWSSLSHDMPKNPSASMQLTTELLQQCIETMPIDKDRIYVTGLSMGGFGVWDIIQRNPKLFAAAIPICGGGDTKLAKVIKDIPIWAFHGDRDGLVKTSRSRDMIAALKNEGGSPLYTEYKGVAHISWIKTYQNSEVFKWLFKQKKK